MSKDELSKRAATDAQTHVKRVLNTAEGRDIIEAIRLNEEALGNKEIVSLAREIERIAAKANAGDVLLLDSTRLQKALELIEDEPTRHRVLRLLSDAGSQLSKALSDGLHLQDTLSIVLVRGIETTTALGNPAVHQAEVSAGQVDMADNNKGVGSPPAVSMRDLAWIILAFTTVQNWLVDAKHTRTEEFTESTVLAIAFVVLLWMAQRDDGSGP